MSYNTLIGGFCRTQNMERAEEFYREMEVSGIESTCATYELVTNGYCKKQQPRINSDTNNLFAIDPNALSLYSKRNMLLSAASLCFFSLALNLSIPTTSAAIEKPSKSPLSRIVNTKNWFLFYGDGFSIRIPPEFEDVMEPEITKFKKGFELCATMINV